MQFFPLRPGEEINQMQYIVAWALGVPGVLIVVWYLMNHH